MAVLSSRAQERRSREIRAPSARERAAKPRENQLLPPQSPRPPLLLIAPNQNRHATQANGFLAGVSLPLPPRAPLAFPSRPKPPFPSLSNACHAGYLLAEWAYLPHRETGERIGDGDIAIFSNNQTQTKMAATVKKDGIRKRRFAQISTKHALSTPYSLQW